MTHPVSTSATSPAPEQMLARGESPVRRTAAASMLALGSLAVKILTGALIIPVALHYLGRVDYGLWILLQTVTSYLLLSDIGLGQTIGNFLNAAYARNDLREANEILTTATGLYLMIAAGVGILSVIAIWRLPVQRWLLNASNGVAPDRFDALLILTCVLAASRLPLIAFPSALVGLRETALQQIVNLAAGAYLLAATVLTLVCGGRIFSLLLITNLGSAAVLFAAYPLLTRRHGQIRLRWSHWNPRWLWPMFANCMPFFLIGVSVLFQRLIGNVLAAKYGSLALVPEIYVLLMLLRVVGWTLADTLSRMLQPYVILWDVQRLHAKVRQTAAMATILTIAAVAAYCTALSLFARSGLRVWLGPDMYLGAAVLWPMVLAFLIDATFIPCQNFMIALNRHHQLAAINGAYALLTVGLGILGARLDPAAPLTGMVWGMLLATILAALPFPWLFRAWLAEPWRAYTRDFLFKPVAIIAPGVIVVAAGYAWHSETMLGSTLALVLGWSGIAWVGWKLSLSAAERTWLLGMTCKLMPTRQGLRGATRA